jgi:hypothetical protein
VWVGSWLQEDKGRRSCSCGDISLEKNETTRLSFQEENCSRDISLLASYPFKNAKTYHRSCRLLALSCVNRYVMVGYSTFMSISCPGLRVEHQGFVRSIGLFLLVSLRVNSRFASFWRPSWLMPACLKRIIMTATNASNESMNSSWNGATLPHASSNITGCECMIRCGISCCTCNT